jgi:ankyrin repeat protein
MITRYKLFENVYYAKKILKSLDIPQDSPEYIKLKSMLGKHQGYLGKFTEWMFKDEFPFEQLQSVFNELQTVKLDKPITEFKSPEEVYDYLTSLKINTKVNQVINSLPSRTRRLANDKLRDLISNNIKYASNIRDFYSKKGGRYKTFDKLYNDTESLIKNLSGGWNVESIKYLPQELVYKDDTTLILHISSYERSNKLGSQHWCISTDEFMWKKYTDDFNKQYFIYDFSKSPSSKESMIGVTVTINGDIYATHYRDDTDANKQDIKSEYGKYLTPYSMDYIRSKADLNNIYNIIKYGFVDELKIKLDQGWDPSADDNYPIRYASEYGHIEIVKILLKDKRVDPSAEYNFAIGHAARYGHTEVVKLLLNDKRVDPSANDNFAIRYAAYGGHTEIVKMLLADDRVDPNNRDSFAIRYAADNGHTEIVKILLADKRVDPSADDNRAIKLAARYGYTDIVKLLLADDRVDPSSYDNFAIRYAAENGHTEIVKMLLTDERVDPSDVNNYAIRYAADNGHTEIVKMLLIDKRVDPSSKDNYALRFAVYDGYIEIVKILLTDKRVDPSADNNRFIRLAAEEGHIEIVKILLNDKRVDPSANNNYAIQLAAKEGHIEIVKLLLADDRVDPSANGNFSIKIASLNSHTGVVKLLLNYPKVRKSLSEEQISKYESIIKN